MIATVGISVDTYGAVVLAELPPPPALRFNGFLIASSAEQPLSTVLAWAKTMRGCRPAAPIWVLHSKAGVAEVIAANALRIRVAELGDDGAPALFDALREDCVEGRILRSWQARFPGLDGDAVEILKAVAAIGSHGGRSHSVSESLGLSISTIRRRLASSSLPRLGELLREARLRSVDERILLGLPRMLALMAAGWLGPKDYRKVSSRKDLPPLDSKANSQPKLQ